jgi:hypothetical protein
MKHTAAQRFLLENWEELGIQDPFAQDEVWTILYQIQLKEGDKKFIQEFDTFIGPKEDAQQAADKGILQRFKHLNIDLGSGWELESGYEGWLNPEIKIGDVPFANYWSINLNYEEEAYSRGYGHNSEAAYAIAYIFKQEHQDSNPDR